MAKDINEQYTAYYKEHPNATPHIVQKKDGHYYDTTSGIMVDDLVDSKIQKQGDTKHGTNYVSSTGKVYNDRKGAAEGSGQSHSGLAH